MPKTVIEVKNVSKDFKLMHHKSTTLKGAFAGVLKKENKRPDEKVQHALKDISFEVKKGDFFGIVGRNGSGKSTLLKMLAGIYQPNKGHIRVDGKLVPFIELGVGFNSELTGRENVYLNGALLGFDQKQVAAMYKEIVEFAELEKFMDQKLKNYSSGMQVRLAFSLAIRADTDILLIDEVLAVGDADFQRKCFDYFKDLKKNKKTVVLVSHDMSAIREYCDRAILIENNKLVAEGKAEKIATLYSRMFTKDDRHKQSEYVKRWGNSKVVFNRVGVKQVKTDDEDKIYVTVNATIKESVDNPIFGFMIKNSASQAILGTNTQIKKVKTGSFKKGEQVRVNWVVPNIFGDGLYYVDPAVIAENTIETYDWWEEAESFRVFKEEKTPYIVAPDVEVALIKVSKK